jgi:hypothetical protein
MSCYTKEQIEKAVKSKGFAWFENGDLNLNIVGVRNSATDTKVTNLFDDCLTLSYKLNGVWQFHCWQNTTDPGTKGVLKFGNSRGIARLVPDQYRGVYSISLHSGKYKALCQRLGKVTVWRDKNRDLVYDQVVKDTGMFGINIHKAGQDSTWVDNWSHGCQVFKKVKDFNEFMSICKSASKIWGNKFTYTLIESHDLES